MKLKHKHRISLIIIKEKKRIKYHETETGDTGKRESHGGTREGKLTKVTNHHHGYNLQGVLCQNHSHHRSRNVTKSFHFLNEYTPCWGWSWTNNTLPFLVNLSWQQTLFHVLLSVAVACLTTEPSSAWFTSIGLLEYEKGKSWREQREKERDVQVWQLIEDIFIMLSGSTGLRYSNGLSSGFFFGFQGFVFIYFFPLKK